MIKFFLFTYLIQSQCSVKINVPLYSYAWLFNVNDGDIYCFNSTTPRTVYSIGQAPLNTSLFLSEYPNISDTVEEFLSSENTLQFSGLGSSELQVRFRNSGNFTASTIGMGKTDCPDGVFATNMVKSNFGKKEIPFRASERRCFFFGSFSDRTVKMSKKLQKKDSIEVLCGNDTIEYDEDQDTFECLNHSKPMFIKISTTAKQSSRNISPSIESESGFEPAFPNSLEKKITPAPVPTSSSKKDGINVIFIIVPTVIVSAAFVGLIFFLTNKKTEYNDGSYSFSVDEEVVISKKPPKHYNSMNHTKKHKLSPMKSTGSLNALRDTI